jgi:cytohesin
LHLAVADRRREAVKLLLEYGADPNARNEYGLTPLHLAWDEPETAGALLEAGAEPTARDEQGLTALDYVAQSGGHPQCAILMLERGVDFQRMEDGGARLLRWAAGRGDKELVELMVAAGAETGLPPNAWEPTALHAAARYAEVVRVLLDHGVEPDLRPSESRSTPLHLAVEAGARESVEELLAAGADPNLAKAQKMEGGAWGQPETAVDMARRAGWYQLEELLREQGGRSAEELGLGIMIPKPTVPLERLRVRGKGADTRASGG